jgi:hypothetical protein
MVALEPQPNARCHFLMHAIDATYDPATLQQTILSSLLAQMETTFKTTPYLLQYFLSLPINSRKTTMVPGLREDWANVDKD